MSKHFRGLYSLIFSLVVTVFFLILIEMSCRFIFPKKGLTWVEEIARQHELYRVKSKDEIRVFIFGASSVIGYHHQGKSSLSIALEYLLRRSDPNKQWKVVNFGKAGEASEFIFDCAKESLSYFPDAVVVYAGENEYGPIPVLRRDYRHVNSSKNVTEAVVDF